MNLITISRRSQLYPKKKKRSIDPAAIDPSLEIQLTRWRTINSIARSETALNSCLQSTLLIRIRQVTRRRFIHGLLIKLLPPPPPTIEERGGEGTIEPSVWNRESHHRNGAFSRIIELNRFASLEKECRDRFPFCARILIGIRYCGRAFDCVCRWRYRRETGPWNVARKQGNEFE